MNKIFMVTGAASGIGLTLTRRLLVQGQRVCACDIDASRLYEAHAGVDDAQLMLQTLDVRSSEQWQALVSEVKRQWQRIDVLCNIAGVLRDNWVADITAAEVDWHFDINTKGTIFGTQAVVPVMQAQKSGHIINIASLAALSPMPGLALYSASKFAVRAYSLAAAMELKAHGIAVTVVCPDAVQTPMLDKQKGREQAALTFSGRRRTLTPDDIVDAIMGRVLEQRPFEIVLPFERGVLAKCSNAFPGFAARFMEPMRRHGMKRQQNISGRVE